MGAGGIGGRELTWGREMGGKSDVAMIPHSKDSSYTSSCLRLI
jgi:hypothetical protein